jgi:hypothetical protein
MARASAEIQVLLWINLARKLSGREHAIAPEGALAGGAPAVPVKSLSDLVDEERLI